MSVLEHLPGCRAGMLSLQSDILAARRRGVRSFQTRLPPFSIGIMTSIAFYLSPVVSQRPALRLFPARAIYSNGPIERRLAFPGWDRADPRFDRRGNAIFQRDHCLRHSTATRRVSVKYIRICCDDRTTTAIQISRSFISECRRFIFFDGPRSAIKVRLEVESLSVDKY